LGFEVWSYQTVYGLLFIVSGSERSMITIGTNKLQTSNFSLFLVLKDQ
jgi:hypothetical protein